MKKKIFTLLTLLLCVCSGAWADEVTISMNDKKAWTYSPTGTGISVTSPSTSSGKTYHQISSGNIVITAENGKTITSITLSTGTTGREAAVQIQADDSTPTEYDWDNGWTGTAQTVTIIDNATSNQARIASISVTYTTSGGGTPTAPTLSSSTPANNATGVATSGNITITFSENVTIKDASKFTLSGGAGTLNTANASVNKATVTIPYSGLAGGTKYTLSTAAGAVTGSTADNAALSNIVFTTNLLAVTNKTWAKDDAAWNDYSGGAAIIDNLQVGTSVSGKSSEKTFADGNTYTKAWSLGGMANNNNEKNIHFKVAGKCRISVYAFPEGASNRTMYIRKGAYNGTEIASKANGGTTDHFILMGDYTTDEAADIYVVAGSNWSVYAVKVEPLVTTGTTNYAAVDDGTFVAHNDNTKETLSSEALTSITYNNIGTLTGYFKSGWSTFNVNSTDYTWIKAGLAYSYVLTPADNVTINSATLYITSNTSTAYTVVTGETETEIAVAGESPSQISLAKTDGKFAFSFKDTPNAEARILLVINYDGPASIDVTVSSAGYATLYYGSDVTIPEGVQAYYGKLNGAKTSFSMTEITDGKIPANTGVILKAAAGTYNFKGTTGATPIAAEDNDLKGTTSVLEVSPNAKYTLGQNSSGVVGMRSFTGTSIRAYCAYMDAPAASRSFYGLSFDDETTGINTVETENVKQKDAAFYNLNGQRVMSPRKGLYIVNGKKVIIK